MIQSGFTTTWLSGADTPRISTLFTQSEAALRSLILEQPDVIIRENGDHYAVDANMVLKTDVTDKNFEILWHDGKLFDASGDQKKLPEISSAQAVELTGATLPWKDIGLFCPKGFTLESVHFAPAPKQQGHIIIVIEVTYKGDRANSDFLLGLNGLPTLLANAIGEVVAA